MIPQASETSSGSFFTVRIALFNGPIDLLLHLVKQRELPIEKLSLAEVTEQYLGCLEQIRSVDIDLAAEYLVIAATLISIKTSVLLEEPPQFDIETGDAGEDPHEALLARLREAQVYKEGAQSLASMPLLGVHVFAPPSSLSELPKAPEKYADHDAMLLGEAFRKLLDRSGTIEPLLTIQVESVSVVERMVQILDRLRSFGERVSFEKLVPDVTSRAAVIVSFIAMLELCKRRAISISQGESFGEILVAIGGESLEGVALESEFDSKQVVNAGNN